MRDILRGRDGFTLIELMIVVAIIGIMAAIAIPQYGKLVNKSHEASTRGNLGQLRSALSIYYGDNERGYPVDDLSSLLLGYKYLNLMPPVMTPSYHDERFGVQAEATPTDSGKWSYNNVVDDTKWGTLVVGCTHTALSGSVWTSY